ncbi:MAG: 50S ribosomal protein L32 [Bacillota bacterium]|uniref:Large ribosomal subunit protein bL32 n=1 Tax=Thermanaerosceptrum fracticalcis TaxID=1712410 RepID=A0A7G6E1J9_THEFR|nr:50S ribosomal protein L32 [Thermanaerosceptrum fracticalcis]MBZ4655434.1 ribosomal protein [Peptococcaceae bacterium]QNB45953.1 50S ribosomal protein L32 [Thermanaerosceptrum fracticalcis]
MGVQQHRRSKARNRRRRAEIMKLEAPKFMECPQCHELKKPHAVCPACGYYKNRVVIAKAE